MIIFLRDRSISRNQTCILMCKSADPGRRDQYIFVSYRVQNVYQNLKSKIRNPKSEIQNPNKKSNAPKSKIRNPKIRNPKSEIQNPRSKIQNWATGGLTKPVGGGTKASNLVFCCLSFVFAENDPQVFRCVV